MLPGLSIHVAYVPIEHSDLNTPDPDCYLLLLEAEKS